MKCSFCQTELPDNSNFCTNCGARLSQPNMVNPHPMPMQPPMPPPMPAQQSAASVKVSKPKGFGIASLIITGIAVLLIAMAFSAVTMIGSEDVGNILVFLFFGGIFSYVLATTFGVFFIGFLLLLAFIFGIVQLAKTRSALSWISFSFSILSIALLVVFIVVALSLGHTFAMS